VAVAVAGLAQGAALWVVGSLAHYDLRLVIELLLVLELFAGALVALVEGAWPGETAGGWPGAMAGALIGGTVVFADGSLGSGLLLAIVPAFMLFTPGYFLGGAYVAVNAPRAGEMSPAARIAVALLVLAADAAIVVWLITSFRYGP
jgi:hypothetical protein